MTDPTIDYETNTEQEIAKTVEILREKIVLKHDVKGERPIGYLCEMAYNALCTVMTAKEKAEAKLAEVHTRLERANAHIERLCEHIEQPRRDYKGRVVKQGW